MLNDMLIFKLLGYAKCITCKALLRCKDPSGKTTTTALGRHKCNETSTVVNATPAITYHFARKQDSVPESTKKKFTAAVSYFCAKDLRPFEVRKLKKLKK